MIIHESIEIIDKSMCIFYPPINKKWTCFSTEDFFWYRNLMFFLVFITKNANADVILVLDFVNVSDIGWKVHVFKIKCLL